MPEDTPTQVRPFAAVLQDLNGGAVAARLAVELHDLIQAVQATSKGGTLVLSLAVKPVAKNNADALNVAAAIAVKAPKEDAPVTVFFVDGDGNAVRNNPFQPQLPLREVPSVNDDRPIREVNTR